MAVALNVIDDVLRREGGYRNDPSDPGGRTNRGISERSHPEAWADDKVTEEEARAIYEQKYVKYPGFDKVSDLHLREQLVDFGVHSGPMVAIQKLQEVLKIAADGILGPKTLDAIAGIEERTLNNLLMAARLRLLGRIVRKNPAQVREISGWINRALEFLR